MSAKAGDGTPPASAAVTSADFDRTLQVILSFGFAGELIVPLAVIGLSKWLSFDVPFWALGPIFAGPIVLALTTALIVWLVRVRRGRTDHHLNPRRGRDGGGSQRDGW